MNTKSSGMLDRTIFDAIPIPSFVVDDDARVLDVNSAGAQFIGRDLKAVYKRRLGDVFHCLHATDVTEGCGRGPACKGCVIRNSVAQCLEGQKVSRRIMSFRVVDEHAEKDFQLLITASPMPNAGEKLALLIVEDITEISKLKTIVPMCMKCRKIRNDEQYWQSVEQYFHEHAGIDFSHGICPQCIDDFFPEYRSKP